MPRRSLKKDPRRHTIAMALALENRALVDVKCERQALRFFVRHDGVLLHYCEHWSCSLPALVVQRGLALCFRHTTQPYNREPYWLVGLECVGSESCEEDPRRDIYGRFTKQSVDILMSRYQTNMWYKPTGLIPGWASAAARALQGP